MKTLLGTILLSLTVAVPAWAEPLVAVGPDQLRMVIERKGATATGTVRYQGADFPFSASVRDVRNGFDLEGYLIDEGERMPFSARRRGRTIVLSADGQQAELTIRSEPRSKEPKPREARKQKPNKPHKRVKLPKKIELRPVEFRDIHMNNMVAYTQLVPKNWKSKGHVEWQGRAPHPQRKIEINGPNGIKVDYIPMLSFEFVELNAESRRYFEQAGAGAPPMPKPNIAPPEDIGAWLATTMGQTDRTVRRARVLEQHRDQDAEAATRAMIGEAGVRHYRIAIAFEKDGRDYRSEILLAYQVLPQTAFTIGRAATWNVFIEYVATFPVELYDSYKALVYTVITSQQATPNWYTAKTQTLSALSNQRHKNAMALIKANGERQRQASDAQMATWRKQQATNDEGHRKFLNMIGDTDDYKLPGGGSVNLPSTHKHVYRAQGGNYVLSDAPLGGGLVELRPGQ